MILGIFQLLHWYITNNVDEDCYLEQSDTILSQKSNLMLISFLLPPTCQVERRERLHLTLPGDPAKLQRVNGEIQYTQ